MPASTCWIPPWAIVLGPDEVPVGEKGCLTRAMRNRPSEPAYRCARMSDGQSSPSSKMIIDGAISLRTGIISAPETEYAQ
jgi:hypothetical protein